MVEKRTYHTQDWIDGWNAAVDTFRRDGILSDAADRATYRYALSVLTPEALAAFLCNFRCPPGSSDVECMSKTNNDCVVCFTKWLNSECDWELLTKIVSGEPYDD